MRIPLSGPDIRCWADESTSKCSVKKLYNSLHPMETGAHIPWHSLWKLEIPPKLIIVLLRIILERLPIGQFLARINQNISLSCSLCYAEEETVNHHFYNCPITIAIWNKLQRSIPRPNASGCFNTWFWLVDSKQNQRLGGFHYLVYLENEKQAYLSPTFNIPHLYHLSVSISIILMEHSSCISHT